MKRKIRLLLMLTVSVIIVLSGCEPKDKVKEKSVSGTTGAPVSTAISSEYHSPGTYSGTTGKVRDEISSSEVTTRDSATKTESIIRTETLTGTESNETEDTGGTGSLFPTETGLTDQTETGTISAPQTQGGAVPKTETFTAQSAERSVSGRNSTVTAESSSAAHSRQVTQEPQVVVPVISKPSSPGTSVFEGTDGIIDYSNADDGYFSAQYTGNATDVKVRADFGSDSSGRYDHDLTADGEPHYYPLHGGSGDYTIGVYANLAGSWVLICSGSFNADIKNENYAYTIPNYYSEFDQDSYLVRKAAEVTAGKTRDIDKIGAIFTFVTDSLVYDDQLAADVLSGKVRKYNPDPDRALRAGKGICFDYASLMAAMARSLGIPSKLVLGYASPDIYHAWNEVYTQETGWITVSFRFAKKGYNRVDATFYSSAENKDAVVDYIEKDSNYSALYYY